MNYFELFLKGKDVIYRQYYFDNKKYLTYVNNVNNLTNENNVDYEELRRLCKYHLENKTDGLCLLGTTAEAESLTDAEKVKIVECAIKEIDGKIPIIVGIIRYLNVSIRVLFINSIYGIRKDIIGIVFLILFEFIYFSPYYN